MSRINAGIVECIWGLRDGNVKYDKFELELEIIVDRGVCEFAMKEKSDSAGKNPIIA
jgi:hypothetical protein